VSRAVRRLRRLVSRRRARRPTERAPPPPPALEVADLQRFVRLPRERLERAVEAALALAPRRRGALSIALVDDRTIRGLHCRHLGIDEPTDVLSFRSSGAPQVGLGEVVASGQTALREARLRGHDPEHELLLYVVHGVLHLLGFGDGTLPARKKMRSAERRALRAAGIRRHLFPSDE
jgi:probable rRNA maturation factor